SAAALSRLSAPHIFAWQDSIPPGPVLSAPSDDRETDPPASRDESPEGRRMPPRRRKKKEECLYPLRMDRVPIFSHAGRWKQDRHAAAGPLPFPGGSVR